MVNLKPIHLLLLILQALSSLSKKTEMVAFSSIEGCSRSIDMQPATDYHLSFDLITSVLKFWESSNSKSTCRIEFLVTDPMVRLEYKICFKKKSFYLFMNDGAQIKYLWSLNTRKPSSYIEKPPPGYGIYSGPDEFQCLDIGDKLLFEYRGRGSRIGSVSGTGNVHLSASAASDGIKYLLPPKNCSQMSNSQFQPDSGTIYSNPMYYPSVFNVTSSGVYETVICPLRIPLVGNKKRLFCYTFLYAHSLSTAMSGESHSVIIESYSVVNKSFRSQDAYKGLIKEEHCVVTQRNSHIPSSHDLHIWLQFGENDLDPEFVITFEFKDIAGPGSPLTLVHIAVCVAASVSLFCLLVYCCRRKSRSQARNVQESGEELALSNRNQLSTEPQDMTRPYTPLGNPTMQQSAFPNPHHPMSADEELPPAYSDLFPDQV